jgi:hypothetical protein
MDGFWIMVNHAKGLQGDSIHIEQMASYAQLKKLN